MIAMWRGRVAETMGWAGPVIPCAVLDYKFRLLSHNTIRGAAGAAILNAELMYRKGLIGGTEIEGRTPNSEEFGVRPSISLAQ